MIEVHNSAAERTLSLSLSLSRRLIMEQLDWLNIDNVLHALTEANDTHA